jgi:hypothetical protein
MKFGILVGVEHRIMRILSAMQCENRREKTEFFRKKYEEGVPWVRNRRNVAIGGEMQ